MSDEEKQKEIHQRMISVHRDLADLTRECDRSGFFDRHEIQEMQNSCIALGWVALNLGASLLEGEEK